jgi:hypothetical protein
MRLDFSQAKEELKIYQESIEIEQREGTILITSSEKKKKNLVNKFEIIIMKYFQQMIRH